MYSYKLYSRILKRERNAVGYGKENLLYETESFESLMKRFMETVAVHLAPIQYANEFIKRYSVSYERCFAEIVHTDGIVLQIYKKVEIKDDKSQEKIKEV